MSSWSSRWLSANARDQVRRRPGNTGWAGRCSRRGQRVVCRRLDKASAVAAQVVWPRQHPPCALHASRVWPRCGITYVRGGESCSWAPSAAAGALLCLQRAVRAGVANSIKNVLDCAAGLVRREAGRRIVAPDTKRPCMGVGVGTILHPAVVLAFADRASLPQKGNCPAAQGADGGAALLARQHGNTPATIRESAVPAWRSQLFAQIRDSGMRQLRSCLRSVS